MHDASGPLEGEVMYYQVLMIFLGLRSSGGSSCVSECLGNLEGRMWRKADDPT